MTRMGKDDVPVNRFYLETLMRKARAHDAYLWACKRMADRRREVSNSTAHLFFSQGYSAALMDFSDLVKQAPPTTE